MTNKFADDLGFDFQKSKDGNVIIKHHGKLATNLRANKAAEFMTEMKLSSFAKQQQIMARITGNYKHGNEKHAKTHPRNR